MRFENTSRWVLPLLVAVLAAPLMASAQVVKDWREIQKPPLPPFKPQQPVRVALPNGMVIFLQENRELPLLNGTVLIRGGSREEPGEKAGLVSLYGQVWRTGGTQSRTGDELDDFLEARAAKVETGGGLEMTTVSFSCLRDDFDDVFRVFAELLRDPAFREDKLPLAKNQINTSIARRNDDPWQIAGREMRKLVYGGDSPYARVPEYESVAAVTRDDLLNWHRSTAHPNNMILGVVGDFDPKKMEEKLREAFGAWPKGPEGKKADVAFRDPRPGYYLVEKEDVNQSNIRMVHLGTRRDNQDYFALEVLNEFFGGSFASRLVASIRTRRGLAYAAGGLVGSNWDYPGIFFISVGTKSETTADAIDAVYEEIDNLYKTPATPEELQRAKDSILNSFVFRFDSKEKVLRERMTYDFYGYPADFLERYRTEVEKVTIDDVARVAKKYIHKDKLAVLVVGKSADFDRPLTAFGPVTNIDITIPEPGARAVASASNAEGKALMAKLIESLGGPAKVREVRALRQKATIRAVTPQGEMPIQAETVVVFPDRFWQKMAMPFGEMKMIVTPSSATMQTPMGTQPVPGAQKEETLKSLKRDPIYVAQHADDPRFTFNAAGTEKVGDVEAKILEVNADGSVFRWFLHPETARILRVVARTTGPSGPGESVTDFSEWKTVEGFPFAVAFTRTRNGQKEFSAQVEEIEVNPSFDPALFEQPAGAAAAQN